MSRNTNTYEFASRKGLGAHNIFDVLVDGQKIGSVAYTSLGRGWYAYDADQNSDYVVHVDRLTAAEYLSHS